MELRKEVAEKYDLVGVPSTAGRLQFNGFGTINLAEIDLARANALAAREFPYLKPKEKRPIALKPKPTDTGAEKP